MFIYGMVFLLSLIWFLSVMGALFKCKTPMQFWWAVVGISLAAACAFIVLYMVVKGGAS